MIKKYLYIVLFILGFTSCKTDDINTEPIQKQVLKNWTMQSSLLVKNSDNEVTKAKYKDTAWHQVTLPTTVLRALVKEGIYPDPHFDLNNFKIPDASDSLNKKLKLEKFSHIKGVSNPFKNPYWFRTSFRIPKSNANKRVKLNFDGINYRADVWINGHQIANAYNMVGMFKRYNYDITPYVNTAGDNIIAVKIHQVDHIGTPSPGSQLTVFGPQRGWGVDIFKDATLKFSAGWDCAPVVRDRNMGIYQDVFLTYTDDIEIIDPYVVTHLTLPDTTSAKVNISLTLLNKGTENKKGVLKGLISLMKDVDFITYKKTMSGDMKPVSFEKEIEIPAGKQITIQFKADEFPQLNIKNPYLWWPNGYGQQYLHTLNLNFKVNGQISDQKEVTFGIRQIDTKIKEIDGEYGRVFFVNGQQIFARGGWLQPDMLLDMNRERIFDEAQLLANANVNMIATEDMPSPPDYVYDAYDKYGLLMWETFFQCWTSYPGTESFANPEDAGLAVSDSEDMIKRYRNHASLVLYSLQCETMVRQEIYDPVKKNVLDLDPTRPFVPTSSYDWDIDKLTPYMKKDMPLGVTDDGAPDYTWYPHEYYYKMVKKVKQQMFRDELGVPSVPVYASMKKFIFDIEKTPKDSIFPLTSKWAHHGAWDDAGYVYRAYDKAIRNRFGTPKTAQEYVKWAQYTNAGSYRAMYEAYNHKMWDVTQGMMIWKLNSTWPTVVWQLYDWYLNPTSAYYFTKRALEPVHIQLNEDDFTATIVNIKKIDLKNLRAEVVVYDFDLNIIWNKTITDDIKADSYKELFKVPKQKNSTDVYYVKMKLINNEGKLISDNFYWFSSKKQVDYSLINTIKPVKLDITHAIKKDGKQFKIKVIVKNNSDKLAFFNRIKIIKGNDGEEVLPTIWSDNFFTLLPGEQKTLTAIVKEKDLQGEKPVIVQDFD